MKCTEAIGVRAALVVAVMFSAAPALAGMCTVGSGAGKKATMAAALADTTCDPILIDGTSVVKEQINITRSVTIKGLGGGNDSANTLLRGARSIVSAPAAKNRKANADGLTYVFNIAQPGITVTLSNFTVDGNTDSVCAENYAGIYVKGATVTLDRVYVTGVRTTFYDSMCTVPKIAVYSNGGTLTMKASTLLQFQDAGVLVNGGSATIQDTYIYGRTDDMGNPQPWPGFVQTGVKLQGGATATLNHDVIRYFIGNGTSCGKATAVVASGAGAVTMKSNVLTFADQAIVLSGNTGALTIGGSMVTEGNRILGGQIPVAAGLFNAGLIGVSSTGNKGGVTIQNNGVATTQVNTCLAGSGTAIAVSGESGTQILNNRIADSGTYGINVLAGAASAKVNNNQLVRSGTIDLQLTGAGATYSGNKCMNPKPAAGGQCASPPYVPSPTELM